ncbi:YiaA/YiaB family inner membrane protein [Enterococcus quebecensis]|uniref:YiaAB two helix domain-containing protein n=1 Tax=Enterococcus quebecensis TaxID=903983 RepID=A0A1E5GQH7_9ENTE|nr:YiaA/YiaB family inner membrane protein [Enterococcus quebecensis]OEG14825.1 hypothetical protein BCR23_12070 [Enterococcus quebecensis]OJG73929.1 hypothetical protein RV12_GL000510 [Enterococcus quebecensis]
MKKKAYRNTPAFVFLSWGSFAFFVALMLIGLYTLKEPLMVKGYYLMGSVGLISSSFTLSKVIRDNQEDEERYNQMFRAMDGPTKKEDTDTHI